MSKVLAEKVAAKVRTVFDLDRGRKCPPKPPKTTNQDRTENGTYNDDGLRQAEIVNPVTGSGTGPLARW